MNAPLMTPAGARGQAPPHNFIAEQALLGIILMRNQAIEAVTDFLRPDHFADPTHGRIFGICAELLNSGRRVDPVILKNLMGEDVGLTDLGGAAYLVRLIGSAPAPANAAEYGQLIFDLHKRRQLIAIGEDLIAGAYDTSTGRTAQAEQEDTESRLFALASDGASDDKTVHYSSAVREAITCMEAAYKADGKLIGITTGLVDLDSKLGGLHPSDLIILAGRPSMGKSALGLNICEAAARAGKTAAFYSLEMSRDQLATRSLSSVSGIESFRIREGKLRAHEVAHVIEASKALEALPMFIEDTGGITVAQLRTRARRLKRKSGLDLIVLDYLQLMQGPKTSGRDSNRTQEISDITRGLKMLAKELNVPILALSQLSRKVEEREDKRPQLSDLRESGSIEQDADVVMFVYREEYYLERSEPPTEQTKKWAEWEARCEATRNTAEVIIGKQRHGPTGTVKTHFDGNLTKFGNLESGYGQN